MLLGSMLHIAVQNQIWKKQICGFPSDDPWSSKRKFFLFVFFLTAWFPKPKAKQENTAGIWQYKQVSRRETKLNIHSLRSYKSIENLTLTFRKIFLSGVLHGHVWHLERHSCLNRGFPQSIRSYHSVLVTQPGSLWPCFRGISSQGGWFSTVELGIGPLNAKTSVYINFIYKNCSNFLVVKIGLISCRQ